MRRDFLDQCGGFPAGFRGACLAALLLGAALLLAGASCEVAPGEAGDQEELSILSWNVQALFDGEDSGSEYSDYAETAGWSGEKYAARLNSLTKGIGQISGGLPDILALVEVENPQTLRDLAAGLRSGGGKSPYRHSFFANVNGMSLGIGVLSKVPLIRQQAHSFTGDSETTPRPVAEVWVEAAGAPLVLFACHWKSKLGGDAETEGLRRASARLILRRLREIEAEAPGTPVLIMGDLNENHDEYYRQAGRYICALLPDDPKAARHAGLYKGGSPAAQADFFVLSSDKPPRSSYFADGVTVLYSPWGRELKGGSYFYNNDWETIDHFLLNAALFDGLGWDFSACEVLNSGDFVNAQGTPNLYNARTGGGLSDHLPLYLRVKLQS
ncbi:MAG: endonuclease/exonuclease/phosphatase family protein [Treponema sp.]|jgi:endonuclease/exonuclease/phosphatase family metal-dependent hydrolase|nr:endonuclease/exonuclease/phosphatase family protein [Treponema sp.]